MRRFSASDIVLKALGLLLVTAAVLKGHELLIVPVANENLWSWRPFLIFQMECELALGIWLVSGVLKRLAWLAALACFSLFCCLTLYKGLTGAASCGCFGIVRVNPWVTLLACDVPATVALLLVRGQLLHPAHPSPHPLRHMVPVGACVLLVGAATSLLLVPDPARDTADTEAPGSRLTYRRESYIKLKPDEWQGKRFPLLRYIDVGEELERGTWIVLMYFHGCLHCRSALTTYLEWTRTLVPDDRRTTCVAVIEIPPYARAGSDPVPANAPFVRGRLSDSEKWLVLPPVEVKLVEGVVVRVKTQSHGESPYAREPRSSREQERR